MKPLIYTFLFYITQNCFLSAQNTLNFSLVETKNFQKTWVSAIEQDSQGFLWVGTQDGLYSYDGYEMVAFKNQPYRNNTLPGNYARALTIKNNTIWIATFGGGLSSFNLKSQKFTNYNSKNIESEKFLHSLKILENNNLYIVSDVGIQYFNTKENSIKKLPFGSSTSFIEEIDNQILLTLNETLYFLDSTNTIFDKRVFNFNIDALIRVENNSAIVGTTSGAYKIDREGVIEKLKINIPVTNLSNSFKNSFYINSSEKIYNYDLNDNSLTLLSHTIPENSTIQKLFIDKEGLLWVGTTKGLYKQKKTLSFFENPNLPYHSRRVISEKNTIYLAGNDGLIINKGSVTNQLFKEYNFQSINKFNNQLWLATSENEIIIYNLLTKKINKIELTPQNKFNPILGIEKDKNHRIWVATFDENIVFDTLGKIQFDFKLPLSKEDKTQKIIDIKIDSKDRLWIATAAYGIFMIPNVSNQDLINSNTIKRFQHQSELFDGLSSNIILSIEEAPDGTMWFGTDNGLVFYDEHIENFKHLNINDNYFNKKVMSIKADIKNNLWISTIFDGIFYFDAKNQTFKNYTTEDGLISNAFLFSSAHFNKITNQLYFGTDEGLQIINLNKTQNLSEINKPFITSIINYSNNNTNQNYYYEVDSLRNIDLNFSERNITLNFSTLDFHYTDKIKFAYSYNENQWTELPNRTVHFTNLPIGKNRIIFNSYLIGQNPKNGVSNELLINILPPWYKTKVAFFIYFLILIGITTLIYYLLLKNKLAKQNVASAIILDEVKSTMYANISHEFKTPLTIIKGLAGRLLTNKEISQKDKESIVSINENGEQLLMLVNQILELVSLDNKQLTKNYKNGDVVAFIKKCISLFLPFTDSKKQKLLFKTSIKSLIMDLDDTKLQKVINNLLSNAIKFTPKEGKIVFSIRQENNHTLILEIQDTGKGIKKEDLPHIFDRYYKTFDLDSNIGSGIGMELTKGLIEFMEGTITVESKENVGTKFTVKLPIKNSLRTQEEFQFVNPFVAPGTTKDKLLETSIKQNKPVILVVEDNAAIRSYFKELFENNYNIIEASNGKKALEISEYRKIDFILSDVMMPLMDGFEFCEKIKNNIKTSHLPFIMVTARTDEKSRLKGYQLGVDAYINKPFNETELLQIIENLIKKREYQIEFYQKILKLNKPENKLQNVNQLDIKFIQEIQEFAINYKQDENMETLAKKMLMSRTQLHRKIKQLTNMSITQYINHIKIQKAKNLLQKTDLTISEIAYEVGYEDPKYFSKIFKNEAGKTPSSFRKKP